MVVLGGGRRFLMSRGTPVGVARPASPLSLKARRVCILNIGLLGVFQLWVKMDNSSVLVEHCSFADHDSDLSVCHICTPS